MGCCNFDKHWIFSIVGLSMSGLELILASVYNFHLIGFALSSILMICSGLYIYFTLKDFREHKKSKAPSTSSSMNNESNESSGLVRKQNDNVMREHMIQEYKGTNTKYNKVAWIIYICFILFISAMAFVRLVCLFRRIEWRNDLDNTFPPACGDWASEHGCTRVTLEADGCKRPGNIPTSNSLVFDENVDRLLNTQIEMCINTIDGAKLMEPDNLSKEDTHNNLIHVTFNSAIFGFIDDMYIITN